MRRKLSVIEDNELQALSLDEMVSQLRLISSEVDEPTLMRKYGAVHRWFEHETNRTLTEKTFQLSLDCFSSKIRLEKPPFMSLVSFKYFNEDEGLTDVNSGLYSVQIIDDFPYVELVKGQKYPTDISKTKSFPVVITYKAGYPLPVPTDIKEALLFRISEFYEVRQESVHGNVSQVPFGADSLLWAYKLPEYQ